MYNSRSTSFSHAVPDVVIFLSSSWFCGGDGEDLPVRRRRAGDNPDERKAAGTRVLLLGRIRELALYRAEVLRAHGYRVITPATKEDALRTIRSGNFDVAVLTYTLPNELVEEFAQLIREYCPYCPLLAITDSNRIDRRISPNETVIADEGPAALIAALHRVTRSQ